MATLGTVTVATFRRVGRGYVISEEVTQTEGGTDEWEGTCGDITEDREAVGMPPAEAIDTGKPCSSAVMTCAVGLAVAT